MVELAFGVAVVFKDQGSEVVEALTRQTLLAESKLFGGERLARQGLDNLATLVFEDYRHTEGQFDHIGSIEMIEAVGEDNWPSYFQTIHDRLKPGGTAAIQAITINEADFEGYRSGPDFIQRYIFPGGALPSIEAMLTSLSRDTDMNLLHLEDFGAHYARTLRHWHDNLRHVRGHLEQLGYDEHFYRLWEFYLCYCEGGFIERAIGTAQLLLAKPGARRKPLYDGSSAA